MVDSGDCSVGSRLLFISDRRHDVEFVDDDPRGDCLGSAVLHNHDGWHHFDINDDYLNG